MSEKLHENYIRSEANAPGSNRSFGFVIAGALALLALFNAWHDGHSWPWTAGLAVLLLAIAWLYPVALRPLNWVWFKFGLLLHTLVSPLILAIMFYVVVTPMGLMMRAFGKDPLRLKRDPGLSSYWILRQPPGPAPENMKDQF